MLVISFFIRRTTIALSHYKIDSFLERLSREGISFTFTSVSNFFVDVEDHIFFSKVIEIGSVVFQRKGLDRFPEKIASVTKIRIGRHSDNATVLILGVNKLYSLETDSIYLISCLFSPCLKINQYCNNQ